MPDAVESGQSDEEISYHVKTKPISLKVFPEFFFENTENFRKVHSLFPLECGYHC